MYKTILPLAALLTVAGPSLAQTPTALKGHTAIVYSVAFSSDGKLLASGSFDNTIKLWEYPSGKEARTLKGHTAQVYSVAFSPLGNLLASGSQDKSVRLWDPKDGKTVKELKGHGDIVQSVAFSPDGKLLATASADKSVRLWDPASGKEVKNLGSHKKSAYCVAFSADGKLLASCSEDTTIKLWDVAGQKEVASLTLAPPQVAAKDPKDMKKPGDKKETKKEEKKETKETKKEVKVGPPPEVVEAIFAVAFTADNASVLSGGLDHFLRVWSVAGRKIAKSYGPAPDYLNGLALSKDGKSVATAGYSGNVRVWDVATGNVTFEHQLKHQGRNLPTYCVAWTPDGRALVSGGEGDFSVMITPIMTTPAKK
jgi:WD40 repeat protein